MSKREELDLSRRGFLKRAGLSAIGFGLGTKGRQRFANVEKAEQESKLPYATLGRTKLKVSRVGVGGGRVTASCVEAAIDRGINLLHTAPNYAGGKSIEAYREVFAHGYRDKVVFALKWVFNPRGGKLGALSQQVDDGLRKAGTDRIDILLPTCHDPETVVQESIKETFDKAKAQGKVRFLGLVTHKFMPQVLTKAVELGWYDVALVAYREPSEEFSKAIKKAREAGMGIIAIKGIMREVRKDPAATKAASVEILTEQGADSMLMTMETMEKVDQFVEIASLPGVAPKEKEALKEARARERGEVCLMCGNCSVCPRGVDVATIMRCKMYNDEYGYREMALEEYRGLAAEQRAENCDGCGLCEEVCRGGLPIRALLASAGRTLG